MGQTLTPTYSLAKYAVGDKGWGVAISEHFDTIDTLLAGMATSAAIVATYLSKVDAASTYLTIADAATDYQPAGSYQALDADLTAIAALGYTSTAFLKKS